MSKSKLWGGRFTESTDSFVQTFTASVGFDWRLYRYDIAGSIAHASMLAHVGVLSVAEKDAIVDGLKRIETEIDAGQFQWKVELEDVHMNIEARLTELIGEQGKKLHTGRSRNDQVATDMRLYLRDAVDAITEQILTLQETLLDIAERESDSIMPGFTHLQTAQPVSFGHHMLAWYEMLSRDHARLLDCRRRINQMPLGAAALAGTSYPYRSGIYSANSWVSTACAKIPGCGERSRFRIELLCRGAVHHDPPLAFFRRAGSVGLGQFDFIELGDAVLHRFLHHAAKEEPRCGRVGAG